MTAKRHMWMSHDGHKASVRAKCIKCGCVRDTTTKTYTMPNGDVYKNVAPECK